MLTDSLTYSCRSHRARKPFQSGQGVGAVIAFGVTSYFSASLLCERAADCSLQVLSPNCFPAGNSVRDEDVVPRGIPFGMRRFSRWENG